MEKDQFATSELYFTYYLGAGASAEALPTINDMSEWFLKLAQILETDKTIESRFDKLKSSYILNLKGMAEQAIAFGTIDTYIKFLYQKDRAKCDEIKNVSTFFFLYFQIFQRNRDKRCLIFLTSVLKFANVFPSNINLIS